MNDAAQAALDARATLDAKTAWKLGAEDKAPRIAATTAEKSTPQAKSKSLRDPEAMMRRAKRFARAQPHKPASPLR